MNTFNRMAAQGDLLIIRVVELPKGLVPVPPEAGVVILGHSETGHHHVMDANTVEMYRLPDEVYECFIVVESPTALRHLRSFDTHAPIMHAPGIYRVRRQREHVPEGWRRAAD
jgi:hypothetical protein